MTNTKTTVERRGPGRPRSIRPEHFDTILELFHSGLGYRSIANHLRAQGVSTAFSTVRRFLYGEGAYRDSPSDLTMRQPGMD